MFLLCSIPGLKATYGYNAELLSDKTTGRYRHKEDPFNVQGFNVDNHSMRHMCVLKFARFFVSEALDIQFNKYIILLLVRHIY